MTAASLNETATAREVLFGENPEEAANTLAEALHQQHAANTLAVRCPGVLSLAEREVAGEMDKLLSLDLTDALVAGWKKYDALVDAARRTRDKPGTEEKVTLATHRIALSEPCQVEVFVDGRSAGTLEVKVSLAFTIAALRAVVSHGRLTTIETGTCTVNGAIAINDHEIRKGHRDFDLSGAVQLRGGLPLLA